MQTIHIFIYVHNKSILLYSTSDGRMETKYIYIRTFTIFTIFYSIVSFIFLIGDIPV